MAAYVCTACALAAGVESGKVHTYHNPDSLHACCDAPGACTCGCEYSKGRACRECGRPRRPGEFDPVALVCIDRADCADYIVSSWVNGRVPPQGKAWSQMVAGEGVEVGLLGTSAFSTGGKGRPRELRGGRCECCGESTRGGRFRMGHDARLASMLRHAAEGGDREAFRELLTRWPLKVPSGMSDSFPEADTMSDEELVARVRGRWDEHAVA